MKFLTINLCKDLFVSKQKNECIVYIKYQISLYYQKFFHFHARCTHLPLACHQLHSSHNQAKSYRISNNNDNRKQLKSGLSIHSKVSSGCIFSQKQVLHTYPSFLMWQQRNIEAWGIWGILPQCGVLSKNGLPGSITG